MSNAFGSVMRPRLNHGGHAAQYDELIGVNTAFPGRAILPQHEDAWP